MLGKAGCLNTLARLRNASSSWRTDSGQQGNSYLFMESRSPASLLKKAKPPSIYSKGRHWTALAQRGLGEERVASQQLSACFVHLLRYVQQMGG